MKVTAKDGKNYTVQRGYLNTEIRDYTPGASVKAIKNFNQETIISDSAYLVFRNETGMRFQVLLGKELTANQFNLSDCNFDRYSLEKNYNFLMEIKWFIFNYNYNFRRYFKPFI